MRLKARIGSDRLRWVVNGAVIAAAFLVLFHFVPYATGYGEERKPITYWLWYFWRFPEWQHGAFVPLILIGLLWRRRAELAGTPAEGTSWGLPLVLMGWFLFYAGHRSNVYYLGYASAQFLAAGTILWFGGWAWFRKLAFFWCFMAFMWPLYFLESRIAFPLRMLMTDISSWLLNLAGIDHIRQGSALFSPPVPGAGIARGQEFALEVADPCSGIRSMFALMMVGALYGYVTLKKSWQWLLVWAAAVPLAIAGNVVRILLLLAGSRLLGSEIAIGRDGGTSTFHFVAGVAVFVVALAGMMGLSRWIRLVGSGHWFAARRELPA